MSAAWIIGKVKRQETGGNFIRGGMGQWHRARNRYAKQADAAARLSNFPSLSRRPRPPSTAVKMSNETRSRKIKKAGYR